MVQQVMLDDKIINVTNYEEETLDTGKRKISFDFKVTSGEYHDVTTLLYQLNFDVTVAERDLEFEGTIHQYYTSITDLYKEHQIGDFHLEIEEV
jgi:hypothetical protein